MLEEFMSFDDERECLQQQYFHSHAREQYQMDKFIRKLFEQEADKAEKVQGYVESQFMNGHTSGVLEFYRAILEHYDGVDVETLRLLKDRILDNNRKFNKYGI